jgi:uncharacterized protein YecT (DUF1311 family)
MKHVFRIALIVACLSVVAAQARADCNNPATDSERALCMAADLRQADDTINTVYQQLMRSISGTDRIALRDAQRAWIKFRDAQCGLNAGTGQRDAWLNQLLKDYQKAVCVTRVTNDRVAELQSMRQPAPQAGAKPTPSPAPRALPSPDDDSYGVVSLNPRTSGKWYFEARVDFGQIAQQAEAALFIGVLPRVSAAQTGYSSIGTLVQVRRKDRGEPEQIVGVAVDLDRGVLYLSQDGQWSARPGSADGLQVKLGTRYVGMLESSVALQQLLAAGAIKVNFGAEPFAYNIPDGYRALDAR